MDDALVRRPFFGALVDGDGVVEQVWPRSPADAVGLRAGDRVVSIDGVPVRTPEQVVARIARHRLGDLATLVFARDGEHRVGPLVIAPLPFETVEGAEVVYGHVAVDGIRQRTILVRPHRVTRPPLVLILGGLAAESVELFPPRAAPLADLVAGLARAGIASLRIEKRGVGDSEGGPVEEVDFDTECAAATATLAAIAEGRVLDTGGVVLFGHSMGGMIAPHVATAAVRGIVAYGTWAGRFCDAMIASLARQRPTGRAANELDAALLRAVVEGEQSIAEACAQRPELAQAPALADGQLFGRTVQYFRQLQRVDLREAWRTAGVPALLLHGDRDVVTTLDEHAAIAALVDGAGVPGRAAQLAGFAHDMSGPDASMVRETIAFVHSVCSG